MVYLTALFGSAGTALMMVTAGEAQVTVVGTDPEEGAG